MLEERFGGLTPGFIRRGLMRVEVAIEQAIDEFASATASGARVLDAGCGEGAYVGRFPNARVVGVDLAVGDTSWDYSGLDAKADLARLPFHDGAFDAALNIVTLEHVPDPAAVLVELGRVLKPNGRILIVAPQLWEVHQAPHDYFRFTRYGLERLLGDAGFEGVSIEPMGGFFTLLARRLVNSLNFFQGGARWVLFPFAALATLPAALVLPSLDFLDRGKDFTLAWKCEARASMREDGA